MEKYFVDIALRILSLQEKAMARVSTYLNFPRNTEEAFNFYKSIFGGEFSGEGIARLGDIPNSEGMPQISEENKKLIRGAYYGSCTDKFGVQWMFNCTEK
jgi:uncharacterized glyoxalase superfamily protein PhnB